MLVTLINNRITNIQTPKKSPAKHGTESTGSVSKMPTYADAKSFVNINFKGDYELYSAVRRDDVDYATVKREIENGTDINGVFHKMPPLTWLMCCHENEDKYKALGLFLAQDNLEINQKSQDSPSWTALQRVVYKEQDSRAVEMLLEREDIDTTVKDVEGEDVWDYVSKRGKRLTDSATAKLKEIYDYQKANPESIGKTRKTSVDIEKLSPEENIWSREEITKKFLSFIKFEKFDKAEAMLASTPLIDLNEDLLDTVCKSGKSNFVRKVFDYEFHKQKPMMEEYESKRKEFFDTTLKGMSYEELKGNNIAIGTEDGFRLLMSKDEFNPNDLIGKESLFDIACRLDGEGELAKEILSKYDDVNTTKQNKSQNSNIKKAVKEYQKIGKYKLKLDNIKRKLINPSTRQEAVNILKEFIDSKEFKPEFTDTMGNSALHIVSTISSESTRPIIQKLLDKGVDINVKNITGQNSIMSAITALRAASLEAEKTNLLSNIKFLIDKGINIEDADKNRQTVFHYVCSTVSVALLTMILAKEPNVLARDLNGNRGVKYLKTDAMKEIYNKYLNG